MVLGPIEPRRSPTIGVMAATYGGIVLSGATFGLILASVVSLGIISLGTSSAQEMIMLLPLGILVGGVLAAISGIPTVLVLLCLSSPRIPLSKGWWPRQAGKFAAICGFVSGSVPIVLTDMVDPQAWLISIVPGVFGGLGTMLFVRWIFRRPAPGRSGDHSRTLVEGSVENVP